MTDRQTEQSLYPLLRMHMHGIKKLSQQPLLCTAIRNSIKELTLTSI